MSAIEMYLKEAQATKGTWHKTTISNLRAYISQTTREEIISAVNKITDASLLPLLWEVGLSQELQEIVNKRSMKLAGKGI